MKKIIFVILTMAALAGCATMETVNRGIPNVSEDKSAGIGDIFFEYTNETVTKDPFIGDIPHAGAFRFDLTIVELTPQKLGLQYAEYTRIMQASYNPLIGPTSTMSDWLVKQGFNKRFDYSLDNKVVRFKDYEFEVLSAENGRMVYKRVK